MTTENQTMDTPPGESVEVEAPDSLSPTPIQPEERASEEGLEHESIVIVETPANEGNVENDDPEDCEKVAKSEGAVETMDAPASPSTPGDTPSAVQAENGTEEPPSPTPSKSAESVDGKDGNLEHGESSKEAEKEQAVEEGVKDQPAVEEPAVSLRESEEEHLKGEVLFQGDSAHGWDNLRWMSLSGSRKVMTSCVVYRRFKTKETNLFWEQIKIDYRPRLLVVYEDPKLIMFLRRASSVDELRHLIGLLPTDKISESELKNYWVAESAVDSGASKLRLSALTTPTSIVVTDGEQGQDRDLSCMELVSPLESIFFSAVQIRKGAKAKERSFADSGAFFETHKIEKALVEALCGAHVMADNLGHVEEDLTWKHQIILGSLHSFVLSGNYRALANALDRAKDTSKSPSVPSRIIDSMDDNKRSPIYYACKQGMNEAMTVLINNGASLDYRTEIEGETLCHICARNLDDKGLAVLLTGPGMGKVDCNVADSKGRSSLYLAFAEGCRPRNAKDDDALRRCVSILLSNGARLFAPLQYGYLQHPLLLLARTFRAHDLSVLAETLTLRFPLASSEASLVPVGHTSVTPPAGESLAALFCFPLHAAIANLRILMAGRAKIDRDDAAKTVRKLLDCGFEPNERVEYGAEGIIEEPELSLFFGFSPLQVLAVQALELEKLAPDLGESLYGDYRSVIGALAEELFKYGARVGLAGPPDERPRTHKIPPREFTRIDINTNSLKLDSNDQLQALLGGKERFQFPQQFWNEKGSAEIAEYFAPWREDKSSIVDSPSPGGNSDKSCAICWKTFGTLMNRKHRCRISWRHICDECSSKRIVVGGKEYRVSDGQFNWSRVQARGKQVKSVNASTLNSPMHDHLAKIRADRMRAEAEANRGTLFGSALEQASSLVFGSEESAASKESTQVSGLVDQLGQTRDALLQRGEKLSSLEEKSAKMVSASEDFARLATQLRKQSEGGLFW